ncbi:MAG: hypothetical protein KF742_08600 [Cryobacterium sp.]|nr:hypothetical protein [Cryobacterium sp.]MBX3658950.1 hypothetical protein [Ramlibacter sp.]
MIECFLKWLSEYAAGLGVLLAAGPVIWGIVQFILVRREEQKRLRFETYHNLIRQLVEREQADQPKKLDRQIAVVFELQDFKHYYPVTLRILKGLRADWSDYGPEENRGRLLEEIDLAVKHIQKRV